MFNPEEYWRKKQERGLRASLSGLANHLKIMKALSQMFSRDPSPTVAKDDPKIAHTRPSKQRRLRRQSHRARMRNVQ